MLDAEFSRPTLDAEFNRRLDVAELGARVDADIVAWRRSLDFWSAAALTGLGWKVCALLIAGLSACSAGRSPVALLPGKPSKPLDCACGLFEPDLSSPLAELGRRPPVFLSESGQYTETALWPMAPAERIAPAELGRRFPLLGKPDRDAELGRSSPDPGRGRD